MTVVGANVCYSMCGGRADLHWVMNCGLKSKRMKSRLRKGKNEHPECSATTWVKKN